MFSKLDIWNLALAMIRAKLVQSENEDSLEAQHCRLHYPSVIASLLEGPHDWGFATRRMVLNAVTNDRDAEWLYAYGLPADMASPTFVLPDLDGLGLGVPIPLPGNPYFEVWSTLREQLAAPYIIENGVLYTNAENASLGYITSEIEPGAIPAKLVDAIAAELAARLAMPVKGDKKLRDEYRNEAEGLRQRAMADDANRQPMSQHPYVSEAERVREGY